MATKKRAKRAASTKPARTRKKTTKRVGARATKSRGPRPGLEELVGWAVTDARFLDQLLANSSVLDAFELDRKTRKQVAQILADPDKVRKAVGTFRIRIGRPSVELV